MGLLLSLSQVSKRFGSVAALSNVDLEVCRGDSLAVFGPNAAGKTTLLRIVASLTKATGGRVEFRQDPGSNSLPRVGYVSHQSLLYNDLTGLENLFFYARLYDLDRPHGRAEAMLDRMGLGRAGGQLVREYSRGMKQRLTLGRALLHEPELLLLDEPYTGLDQHGGRLLTGLLRQVKEEGRTLVLVTHNLAEGLDLCDRAMVLHRGRLVWQQDPCRLSREELERLYFETVERS